MPDFPYFDIRVIIAMVIVTVFMMVACLIKHRFAFAALFAGLFFLSLNIAAATLAVKDRIEDLEASIKDDTLHSASGFAALPQWAFDSLIYISLAFFVFAGVLFVFRKKNLDDESAADYEKMQTGFAKLFARDKNKNSKSAAQPSGIQHTN